MREIGGYIEFEYFNGKPYHEGALALNSGRHCVEYLIRAKKISKIFLPYFLCDSINELCVKLGVAVQYYHVGQDFKPNLDDVSLGDNEYIYIVNFYGQLCDKFILELKKKYDNIIVDNAQAFFARPIKAVDTCYTARKFFGVSDGGYLYTDAKLSEKLEKDCSHGRMEFLFGRMDCSANEFYARYASNNELFSGEPLKEMSNTTANIMRGLDYKKIADIRFKNFKYLNSKFKQLNKLDLTIPKGAFAYPLYVDNGREIRKILQAQKIYIPTLWTDVLDVGGADSLEMDMALNILPLPVDQRYGLDDMRYLADAVMKAISENA